MTRRLERPTWNTGRGWVPATVSSLLLVVTFSTRSANADPASSDDYIQQGIALRRERKDREALAAFRRAYDLDPTPRALAQIGLAEAALEQWVDAEADLSRALAGNDAWIQQQRAVLTNGWRRIQGHLGTLRVTGPDGTEVWIDGSLVATLPRLDVMVAATHLTVELRKAGFESDHRDIDVAPGSRVDIAANLAPVPPEPKRPDPPAPPAAAEQPAPSVPKGPARLSAPREGEEPPTGRYRTAALATGGVAVVFALTGAAFLGYAADRASHYNDNTLCGDLRGASRSVRCASFASQFQFAQAAELTSFALGAASAVAAGLLFVLDRHRAVGVTASFTESGGDASLRFSF